VSAPPRSVTFRNDDLLIGGNILPATNTSARPFNDQLVDFTG
jgi:hypothetical protein